MRNYHNCFKPTYFNINGSSYALDEIARERTGFGSEVVTFIKAHAVDRPDIKCESLFEIKKVIYSDPATIVIWTDGTKTVVKCQEDDIYDEQTGLLMCIAKKAYGNTGEFNNVLREWEPKVEEEYCSFNFDLTPVWDCLGDFIKTLDPSGGIMKNRKWIPCSERLPEKSGEYLVSYRLFDGDIQTRTELFVGGEWGNEYVDHIAWMPLPEPYKAE